MSTFALTSATFHLTRRDVKIVVPAWHNHAHPEEHVQAWGPYRWHLDSAERTRPLQHKLCRTWCSIHPNILWNSLEKWLTWGAGHLIFYCEETQWDYKYRPQIFRLFLSTYLSLSRLDKSPPRQASVKTYRRSASLKVLCSLWSMKIKITLDLSTQHQQYFTRPKYGTHLTINEQQVSIRMWLSLWMCSRWPLLTISFFLRTLMAKGHFVLLFSCTLQRTEVNALHYRHIAEGELLAHWPSPGLRDQTLRPPKGK